MFGLNHHQSRVTAEPIKKWPCLPPLYLHVFYSLISRQQEKLVNSWGREMSFTHPIFGTGRNSHYDSVCVPQDICDLKILSWLGVPWWQCLIHLSIMRRGSVAQPQYGKLFVQESCPLSWRIYSSSMLALNWQVAWSTPSPGRAYEKCLQTSPVSPAERNYSWKPCTDMRVGQ